MSTSKYSNDDRQSSICVGDQHISFTLKEIVSGRCTHNKKKQSMPRLSLLISDNTDKDMKRYYWEDSGESKLESYLTSILNDIVVLAEVHYRHNMQQSYSWAIKLREKKEEEIRQSKLDEERTIREHLEKEELLWLEQLLSEASSIQQAETIRKYVEIVTSKASEIGPSIADINRWAAWALHQADKIDPIKNKCFLNFE